MKKVHKSKVQISQPDFYSRQEQEVDVICKKLDGAWVNQVWIKLCGSSGAWDTRCLEHAVKWEPSLAGSQHTLIRHVFNSKSLKVDTITSSTSFHLARHHHQNKESRSCITLIQLKNNNFAFVAIGRHI